MRFCGCCFFFISFQIYVCNNIYFYVSVYTILGFLQCNYGYLCAVFVGGETTHSTWNRFGRCCFYLSKNGTHNGDSIFRISGQSN